MTEPEIQEAPTNGTGNRFPEGYDGPKSFAEAVKRSDPDQVQLREKDERIKTLEEEAETLRRQHVRKDIEIIVLYEMIAFVRDFVTERLQVFNFSKEMTPVFRFMRNPEAMQEFVDRRMQDPNASWKIK